MPIYEFRCDACGESFEKLVAVGTEGASCPACGAEGARRSYSAPAAPFKIARGPGETRKQERRNAALRDRTKAKFKQKRQRARAARDRARGGGG